MFSKGNSYVFYTFNCIPVFCNKAPNLWSKMTVNNPLFLIYKSDSDCIYIMSTFSETPIAVTHTYFPEEWKKHSKIKEAFTKVDLENWQEILGPTLQEKIMICGKNLFSLLCPFYEDVMRFHCLCYLSSDVREFTVFASLSSFLDNLEVLYSDVCCVHFFWALPSLCCYHLFQSF